MWIWSGSSRCDVGMVMLYMDAPIQVPNWNIIHKQKNICEGIFLSSSGAPECEAGLTVLFWCALQSEEAWSHVQLM